MRRRTTRIIDPFMMDPRIEKGMAAQRRQRDLQMAGGDRLAGWKIAFGSPEGLKLLKLESPIVGFLTEQAALTSGATLELGDFVKPVVEPEIAIVMGADLAPGAKREEIVAAIAGLAPALEIADLAFAPDDVERVLASDIYQRHWILGTVDASRAGARLDGLSACVCQTGATDAETNELESNTGELVSLVGHVAEYLAAVGDRLEAGQFIIAGSIMPPLFITGPTEVSYSLDPIDEISVCFD